MFIPVVLLSLAAAVVLAWLAVASMPEGKTRRALMPLANRLLRAYLFGGLIGAVYGAAACPDHFSTMGQFRFVGVHALIGMVLWAVGWLVVSGLARIE